MYIATYTEPSVAWEGTHGLARSWNLLAGRECYSSLEDRTSLLWLKQEEEDKGVEEAALHSTGKKR